MSEPNTPDAPKLDEAGDLLGIIRRAGVTLPRFADGGYPILYTTTGDDTVCAACANQVPPQDIAGAAIFYEGAPWQCDVCGTLVASAYGGPEC